MAITSIRGKQIVDGSVQRTDLDTTTVGQAVTAKIIQGSGISLSSTGADAGTGDVTVSSPDVVSTDAGNIAVLGTDNHILVPQSQIWSTRLRSFNALGNSTFECDQIQCGTALALTPTNVPFLIDRWWPNMPASPGTARLTSQQTAGNIVLPGTNFFITSKFLRLTLTAQQTTLLAADHLLVGQSVEGPMLRELLGDVHSISLLVRSSVANLKFSVSLIDTAATQTRCLAKLCTLGAANTWTLIQLSNLPVWSAGGTFPVTPGVAGYYIMIGLAGGTSTIVAANDTWQNTTAHIATGISNFAASAVSSTFDIAYIGHEPGALCTTPQDCQFGQNLDGPMGCQRYYSKTYNFGTKAGTASTVPGRIFFEQTLSGWGAIYNQARFKKTMAKVPTVTFYSDITGAANTIRDSTNSADRTASISDTGMDDGFCSVGVTSPAAGTVIYTYHYVADTAF